MRRTGPVLVDTNVILECWRVGSWRALANGYSVETVDGFRRTQPSRREGAAMTRVAEVRARLVDILRRDLVGPGPQDQDLARERLSENPSRWSMKKGSENRLESNVRTARPGLTGGPSAHGLVPWASTSSCHRPDQVRARGSRSFSLLVAQRHAGRCWASLPRAGEPPDDRSPGRAFRG
jgi:hypothetical protein